MRARVWLFGTTVLMICVLVVLFWSPKQEQPALDELDVGVANEQSPPAQQKAMENRQVPNSLNTSAIPPAMVAPIPPSGDSNTLAAQMLATWQAPIEFYGKVVDENSKPLPGVRVSFHWVESPDESGNRTSTTESDGEGLFSLRDARGPNLSVSISKEGYYMSREKHPAFKYGFFANSDFSPNPQNPIIFHLQKVGNGEPLIHIAGIGLRTMRDFLLDADGKPTEVSLRDGRLAPAGQGDLKVEFQAGESIAPAKISWRCRVTLPSGGLIQTDEEFPFLAPESGYKETDEWNIGSTNWTEQVNKQYFVKLRDGNFGRVNLRVIGVPKRAFFRMESFLNPSGSRNLEPSN